ncbi:AraC family transcriptional regulator [Peribacillus loiseleuriae]|uniref:AraC family transcriptional regulator n=1 Tax=Peribacillus loiseleuriae TaxID=1679170 RepID=UPI003D01EBA2
MRIKNYADLLEVIDQDTRIEEYFMHHPDKVLHTLEEQFLFLKGNKILTDSSNYIMNKDTEGIITSYPNNELIVNQFAIKRKIKYMPIMQHRHEYIEIVYVLEGSFLQEIKGKQVEMKQGDLCILDKNVTHSSLPLAASDVAVNIILTPEFFDGIFMHLLSDDNYMSNFIINSLYSKSKTHNYLKHHVEHGSTIKVILDNLLFEYFSSDTRSWAAINGYLLILFTELSRENIDNTGEFVKGEHKKVKDNILNYIRKRYKDTNLKKMADYFHFHPSYLSSLIKKEFGKNLIDLLTEVRMSEACNLLKNTDMTIENIIFKIGYSNVSYFYKLFKKTYGVTPTEYKNRFKKS